MPVDKYVNTGQSAGEEASSGGEGRVLTFAESVLTHPYHSDGFVDGKDPVLIGNNTVGVALKGAAAATDMIAVDTEGIFWLNVLGTISDGTNNGAARALAAGDPVYIQKVPSTDTYLLSGQDDPANFVPFGYTLSTVTASLTVPTLVAVKVHWDPITLDQICVGSLTLVNEVVVSQNHDIEIAAARAVGEDQESWGLDFSWMKCFIGLDGPLNVDEDFHGIYMRVEDKNATTGGDLFAARFQTHANNAAGVWTRLYGQMIAISNEASATVTESFGLSVNMGGAGAAPAVQSVFQVMGDGTLGTLQSWFQTEIGRGAGLEANVRSLNINTTHQIPMNINGVIYAIPVVAWN